MRYTESSPETLTRKFADGAPAIVPIGALEWHGPHLPLGLDLILAEWFAAELTDRLGGVLLPGFCTPMTTLPHPTSLQVRTEAFRGIIDDTVEGLVRAGARTIVFVSGHYAQGHMVELYEAAMRAMEDVDGLRMFVGSPLEPLGDEDLLDHAAHVETACLLAVRPDLVHLEKLDSLEPARSAVLGKDPRHATAEEGRRLLQDGLEAWVKWMEQDILTIMRGYGDRFDAYDGYVRTYLKGTWEDAIIDWWAEKTGQVTEENDDSKVS